MSIISVTAPQVITAAVGAMWIQGNWFAYIMDTRNWHYVFQQLYYLDFLEFLGNKVLDHYHILPQFISHPMLISDCMMHYQQCTIKLDTLDSRKKFLISSNSIRTLPRPNPPTHLSPLICKIPPSIYHICSLPQPPPSPLSLSYKNIFSSFTATLALYRQ